MYINKIQFVIIVGASIVKEATLLTVQQINQLAMELFQLAMELCISVFRLLLSRGEIKPTYFNVQFSLSRIWLFATPWTATRQASLSITKFQSLFKLMCIDFMMPSSHHILCHPLLFLSSVFPSISIFSNGSVLPIRWPKYWSFSFSISAPDEYSELSSFRIVQFYLLVVLPFLSYVIGTDRFWGMLWFCWRCSVLESTL